MKIDKTHEIVGKTLSEIKSLDIGSLYPVLVEFYRVPDPWSAAR